MRGKKLLQVSGILLIVFYGLGILSSCISVFSLIGIQAEFDSSTYGLSSYLFNFESIWVSFIVSVIVTIFGLTVGILGVTMCKQPEKAKICLAMGITLLILTVIERVIFITCILSMSSKLVRFDSDLAAPMSVYTVFAFIGMLIALVTPLLYTIGAALYSKNNNNMNNPYNNIGGNQYQQYNNGNGQYPNNQYPNNQNNQNDYQNY